MGDFAVMNRRFQRDDELSDDLVERGAERGGHGRGLASARIDLGGERKDDRSEIENAQAGISHQPAPTPRETVAVMDVSRWPAAALSCCLRTSPSGATEARITHLARYDETDGASQPGHFRDRDRASLAVPRDAEQCRHCLFIDLRSIQADHDTLGHLRRHCCAPSPPGCALGCARRICGAISRRRIVCFIRTPNHREAPASPGDVARLSERKVDNTWSSRRQRRHSDEIAHGYQRRIRY